MTKKLLLVDDEEGIRRVLSVFLADFGYAVVTAADGLEALDLLAACAPEDLPAVVLTDVRMPGLDGLGLLKAVKERWPELEVLMLTGHGDMDMAVASLQHGAGDFLNKPVSELALKVSLRRAEERRAMREALRRHAENLEALVERRTRELLESERFAAVGEAAASLAHAIKNVAGGLEGTMFVLERGLSQNRRDYLEEGWEMIRDDVARLKTLAVGLLDLGKAREPRYAPCDPDKILQEVGGLFRSRAAEAGIELTIQPGAGPEAFVLDAEAAHQCLSNLLLNAIEALEGRAGEKKILLSAAREKTSAQNSVLRYSVGDNGPGLPQGLDGSGGPRFMSSKEKGSGIGLFATRKLALEMGGGLSFRSGPEGTEASLEIPEKERCGRL